jgi:DNA-binding transcriptional LysR family regulator
VELRQLRYFVTVAEELHFRRAAEQLHIVQPALSKQVSLLEKELGVLLLERDRRHVALTDAGRALLDEAREMLAQAEGAAARARAVGRGEGGRLTIGFIQPAVADVLPRSLRAFGERYPDVRLTLTEATSRTAVERIVSRSLDLAFTRLPIEDRPELCAEPVSEEEVVLVTARSHPLAERASVRLAELAGEQLILVDRRVEPELHDYYLALCQAAGFEPRVAHEVNSTWVAIGLAAGGLGVGFAPQSARLAAQHNVAYIPIADDPPRLTMGVMWRTGPRPRVVDNFLALRPWQPAP